MRTDESDPFDERLRESAITFFVHMKRAVETLYFTLVRWWPGYMSAPHTYVTDRLCVVLSGTWWCNSGDDFDPASCVPVPAGSFVRRVAGTSHYDGVIRNHAEPAIIAICGMGPVGYKLVDPSQPGWRQV